MNKNELINEIAVQAEITKNAAERALAGLLEAIENGLASGDTVNVTGFGAFSIQERTARIGRNPQTGQQIDIPAKKVVKFKAGKILAAAVE